MQRTTIEYLTHTSNPVIMRCTRVSPGCERCWHLRTADRMAENPKFPRLQREIYAGRLPFKMRPDELKEILKIKNAAVGVQFMGDLFHPSMPDDFICKTIVHAMQNPNAHFLFLTKRPDRMYSILCNLKSMHDSVDELWWRRNVWYGVTICTQKELNLWAPFIMHMPVYRRWISLEPLLEEVNLLQAGPFNLLGGLYHRKDGRAVPVYREGVRAIDAVVVGGETGKDPRYMQADWVRRIRDDCVTWDSHLIFKQWGGKKLHNILDEQQHMDLPWRTR